MRHTTPHLTPDARHSILDTGHRTPLTTNSTRHTVHSTQRTPRSTLQRLLRLQDSSRGRSRRGRSRNPKQEPGTQSDAAMRHEPRQGNTIQRDMPRCYTTRRRRLPYAARFLHRSTHTHTHTHRTALRCTMLHFTTLGNAPQPLNTTFVHVSALCISLSVAL